MHIEVEKVHICWWKGKDWKGLNSLGDFSYSHGKCINNTAYVSQNSSTDHVWKLYMTKEFVHKVKICWWKGKR